MHIREFGKPVTAKSLNETLAKRFGSRLSLEQFTLEQLQDARNKLRTKLSQIEMSESFSNVLESDNYQKSKMFLDVLNAEISERGGIEEAAKPDYIDLDKDGNKKEPMKKAATDAKKKKIKEGAEDQAELVMAAKDMVERLTGWMEDTAEMQTESMLELADAIRDELGIEQSTQFVEAIKPALEALYNSMEQARESLSAGVSMLTGEQMPAQTMGAEPGAEPAMEPTVDMEEPPVDEFGAAAPAAGGEEPAARPARESINRSKKKISEGNDPQTSRIIRGFIQELKKTDPQMSYKVQDLAMKTKRQTNDDKAVWYAIADHPEFGKYLDQYYDTINTGKNNPAAGGNLQRGYNYIGKNPPAAGYNLGFKNPASAPSPQAQGESANKVIEKKSYSAKAARAGKDIGKPGKQFSKIAKSAGEKYGSKERGEKVAGAVLKKLRAKESVDPRRVATILSKKN